MPHSEIEGSKPILGSPSLIAEYHVLHRLLLPRHPPNALLALDLIQKKTGLRLPGPAGSSGHILLNQKHTFPLLSLEPAMPKVIRPLAEQEKQSAILAGSHGLVYLTWRLHAWWSSFRPIAFRLLEDDATWSRPTRQDHMKSDVYLSIRCQFIQD